MNQKSKNQKPAKLVSVVIPAFNHQDYVENCLKSVYDQSYKNIEIIFIDDVSTDKTLDKAKAVLKGEFSRRFENIIVQSNDKNMGAHHSINAGIALAKGEYIAILNSDDLFHPKRLETMIKALEKDNAMLAFSICQPLLEPAEDKNSDYPLELIHLPLSTIHSCAHDISVSYALLRKNVAVTTGNFVFKKELVDHIGPFVPLKYCHDWDFILQSTKIAEPVFVPEPLYLYRIHPTNSFRAYQTLARFETQLVRERFFKAISISPPQNCLCPCPEYHAGYFEIFLSELKILDVWRRISKRKISWHRTSVNEAGAGERSALFVMEDSMNVNFDELPAIEIF